MNDDRDARSTARPRSPPTARCAAQIKKLQEDGYGHYPVCVAKTQYSFSTDPHAARRAVRARRQHPRGAARGRRRVRRHGLRRHHDDAGAAEGAFGREDRHRRRGASRGAVLTAVTATARTRRPCLARHLRGFELPRRRRTGRGKARRRRDGARWQVARRRRDRWRRTVAWWRCTGRRITGARRCGVSSRRGPIADAHRHLVSACVHALQVGAVVAALQGVGRVAALVRRGNASAEQPRASADRSPGAHIASCRAEQRADRRAEQRCADGICRRNVIARLRGVRAERGLRVTPAGVGVGAELLCCGARSGQHVHRGTGRRDDAAGQPATRRGSSRGPCDVLLSSGTSWRRAYCAGASPAPPVLKGWTVIHGWLQLET